MSQKIVIRFYRNKNMIVIKTVKCLEKKKNNIINIL